MDKAPTETVTPLRRAVRRTLTVVGGAIGASAIAWVISSASASAESTCEAPQLPPVPGLSELAGAGQQALRPVSDVVCSVRQVVPVSADSGPVTQAAGDLGRMVTDRLEGAPETPTADPGRGDRPATQAAPGGTPEPASLARPAGDPPAAAIPATVHRFGGAVAATGGADRTPDNGVGGSPEPAPLAPREPTQLPGALPGAPAGVPSPGSSGQPGGGADSPAFAVLPRTDARLGRNRWHAVPAGDLVVADEPGTQPGITPD